MATKRVEKIVETIGEGWGVVRPFIFDEREREIRRLLRGIARQRVVALLPQATTLSSSGPLWVVERAYKKGEDTEAHLQTCRIRGWIEVLVDAVPSQELTKDGRLPDGFRPTGYSTIYRLTQAGWDVIHGTKTWIRTTCIVAFFALMVSFATLVVTILAILK